MSFLPGSCGLICTDEQLSDAQKHKPGFRCNCSLCDPLFCPRKRVPCLLEAAYTLRINPQQPTGVQMDPTSPNREGKLVLGVGSTIASTVPVPNPVAAYTLLQTAQFTHKMYSLGELHMLLRKSAHRCRRLLEQALRPCEHDTGWARD